MRTEQWVLNTVLIDFTVTVCAQRAGHGRGITLTLTADKMLLTAVSV